MQESENHKVFGKTESPRDDRDASSMKPQQDLNNTHAEVDGGECTEPTSRSRTIGN